MTEKVFQNRRDWLNPKGNWDTGAISSKVSADLDGVEGDVSLWDCGKKISLSFSIYSEKSAKERKKKIELMIDHLLSVQESLGKAYDHYMIEKEKEDIKNV